MGKKNGWPAWAYSPARHPVFDSPLSNLTILLPGHQLYFFLTSLFLSHKLTAVLLYTLLGPCHPQIFVSLETPCPRLDLSVTFSIFRLL